MGISYKRSAALSLDAFSESMRAHTCTRLVSALNLVYFNCVRACTFDMPLTKYTTLRAVCPVCLLVRCLLFTGVLLLCCYYFAYSIQIRNHNLQEQERVSTVGCCALAYTAGFWQLNDAHCCYLQPPLFLCVVFAFCYYCFWNFINF